MHPKHKRTLRRVLLLIFKPLDKVFALGLQLLLPRCFIKRAAELLTWVSSDQEEMLMLQRERGGALEDRRPPEAEIQELRDDRRSVSLRLPTIHHTSCNQEQWPLWSFHILSRNRPKTNQQPLIFGGTFNNP